MTQEHIYDVRDYEDMKLHETREIYCRTHKIYEKVRTTSNFGRNPSCLETLPSQARA